jgi:hypothetical protein
VKKVDEKRSYLFFKSLEIVKKLEGPQLVRESKLLTKDKLGMELNILKTLWDNVFDNITKFLEDEIK